MKVSKTTILTLICLVYFYTGSVTWARTTPADIVNSQQQAYNSTVSHYSLTHQQTLKNLLDQISQINKSRTDQLAQIIQTQAAILEEYNRRHPSKDNNRATPDNDSPLYWLTYTHEAVAYQAAKIYIFNLTSEANIKSDAMATINLFEADLESTRSKVIKSQNIIAALVKND